VIPFLLDFDPRAFRQIGCSSVQNPNFYTSIMLALYKSAVKQEIINSENNGLFKAQY
jgi:hypothetical protein